MAVMARAKSWFGQALSSKENLMTDLYVIENGTLLAFRYYYEILDQFVRLYAGAIGQEFIQIDDNANSHHVHVTNAYLEHESICRMD